MNDNTRSLIKWVCENESKRAQQQARIMLAEIKTQKDERFKASMMRKLDAPKPEFIEVPPNLKKFLTIEDVSNFPDKRFFSRKNESQIANKVVDAYHAADELSEMGISYSASLILHGQSGGGKTMLARRIAYELGLPFAYIKFSGLIASYLGSTSANINLMFEYVKSNPCVLCIDEIDALGMSRGTSDNVKEMDRVAIGLMQELDNLPNNIVVIGTTNRLDCLDAALVRRFHLQHKVLPLNRSEMILLATKFFESVGYETDWVNDWCESNFSPLECASRIVDVCTDKVISDVVKRQGIEKVKTNGCGKEEV